MRIAAFSRSLPCGFSVPPFLATHPPLTLTVVWLFLWVPHPVLQAVREYAGEDSGGGADFQTQGGSAGKRMYHLVTAIVRFSVVQFSCEGSGLPRGCRSVP